MCERPQELTTRATLPPENLPQKEIPRLSLIIQQSIH